MQEPSDWFYRKLYAGRVQNGIDHLVLDLLPKVSAIEGLRRWFFVRFADLGGSHMRLRLRLPVERHRIVDRLVEGALQRLPTTPPSLYRPAIGPADRDVDRHSVIRLVAHTYIAEHDRFGANGMAVAEACFQRSSEIAVGVLQHEARGLYSRKSVVLHLMAAVKDAFVPDASAPEYWRRYSEYWLERCNVDVEKWRITFGRKASALAEAGVELPPSASSLPDPARPQVVRWFEAARSCATAYAAGGRAEIPMSVLAINFAHLMNNRLGLFPLEDAYYGALLHAGFAGSVNAAPAELG